MQTNLPAYCSSTLDSSAFDTKTSFRGKISRILMNYPNFEISTSRPTSRLKYFAYFAKYHFISALSGANGSIYSERRGNLIKFS